MYEKITLPNGVRILYENIPYVRSVSLGIWVGCGSRYESFAENGASHFIEHMVFKGTSTRTAFDIANMMDSIGGQINAFTTKECTCFYGHVLDTHLRQLSDVLSDMFYNSKFDEADVEGERGVIFEEIDMYEDSPEDLVSERLISSVFKGSSLSRPILGKKQTLSKMTGQSLKKYMQEHYGAESTVIALCGNFTKDDIAYLCDKFSEIAAAKKSKVKTALYKPEFVTKKKRIEQNHICFGFPGISISDDIKYAMQLCSSILGGGMSSRLFQTVREEHGLCYSVYSFGTSYIDTGMLGIYTALSGETEEQAIKVILDVLKRFRDDGVTDDELCRAREQVKANVLMSLESTNARMNRLGRNELFLGKIPEPEEIIAIYNGITKEDIRRAVTLSIDFEKMSLSAVGKVKSEDNYRELIAKCI